MTESMFPLHHVGPSMAALGFQRTVFLRVNSKHFYLLLKQTLKKKKKKVKIARCSWVITTFILEFWIPESLSKILLLNLVYLWLTAFTLVFFFFLIFKHLYNSSISAGSCFNCAARCVVVVFSQSIKISSK